MLKEQINLYFPGIVRAFSNITPVIIFFIFAQFITIPELGLLNYIISLITIVGVFTDFGIPEAIQRFLPQIKNKTKLITYTVKLEFLVVLLGALLFLLFDLLTKNLLSKGFLALFTITILFSASNSIILIFNGLQNQKLLSKFFGYSSLLFLFITFFLHFGFNLAPTLSFIYARLISWGVYTLLPIIYLKREGLFSKQKFVPQENKRFNKFAINTFIYVGSITLLTQWDSMLITSVDGVHTNGLYKSVAFIATIPIVLVTILQTRLLPLLSKLHSEHKTKEIAIELRNNIKFLFLILSTTFLIQLFIYKPLLNIFLNQEIVEKAGHLFPMIFLAICIHILISPYISTLQAIGREKFVRNLAIIQVFSFVFLSTIFYSNYSYSSLPILLILINSCAFFTTVLFTKKELSRI